MDALMSVSAKGMADGGAVEPNQSDPWAWQQRAAKQDEGLYGWKKTEATTASLAALKPSLVKQGKWTPQLEAAMAAYKPGSEGRTSDAGTEGPAAAEGDVPLSSLGLPGYSTGRARSSANNKLDAVLGPDGNPVEGTAQVSQPGGSFKSRDYRDMAVAGAAMVAGGYGLSAMTGGAAAGTGAITGTTGTTAAATTGATAAGTGTIAGGTGITLGGVSAGGGAAVGGGASVLGGSAAATGLTAGQWLGVAQLGVGVVGAVASNNTAKKIAGAANDTANKALAAQEAALGSQVAQADRVLEFNKQMYADGKARQVDIDAVNKRVVEQNLDLSAKAGVRADETYDFYKTNGRPVVEKTLKEAGDWDSQGNIDAARGRATADVAQGFEGAEQQSQRALTRMGINPSSGRFMAVQQRLAADKAAAMAGAGTNAEEGRRVQGVGMRQQASNIAQGLPAQSLAQGAQSSVTGVAAAGVAGAGGAQNLDLGRTALSGMNMGAGIYGSAANGYGNIYGQASTNASNANATSSNNAAGWGNLIGNGLQTWLGPTGKADGGRIEGPGTGTSDSVPAVNRDTHQPIQLSNGEYIMSADTVRAKGTKFFDDLQAKHHKPVNIGRAA